MNGHGAAGTCKNWVSIPRYQHSTSALSSEAYRHADGSAASGCGLVSKFVRPNRMLQSFESLRQAYQVARGVGASPRSHAEMLGRGRSRMVGQHMADAAGGFGRAPTVARVATVAGVEVVEWAGRWAS